MFLQPIAIFSQKLEGLRGHLGCVQVRLLSDKQRVDLKLRIGRLHLNSGGKNKQKHKIRGDPVMTELCHLLSQLFSGHSLIKLISSLALERVLRSSFPIVLLGEMNEFNDCSKG